MIFRGDLHHNSLAHSPTQVRCRVSWIRLIWTYLSVDPNSQRHQLAIKVYQDQVAYLASPLCRFQQWWKIAKSGSDSKTQAFVFKDWKIAVHRQTCLFNKTWWRLSKSSGSSKTSLSNFQGRLEGRGQRVAGQNVLTVELNPHAVAASKRHGPRRRRRLRPSLSWFLEEKGIQEKTCRCRTRVELVSASYPKHLTQTMKPYSHEAVRPAEKMKRRGKIGSRRSYQQ